MSTSSDTDDENFEIQNDKDEDFKINNYEKEIDSDDSYCNISKINNDENAEKKSR